VAGSTTDPHARLASTTRRIARRFPTVPRLVNNRAVRMYDSCYATTPTAASAVPLHVRKRFTVDGKDYA